MARKGSSVESMCRARGTLSRALSAFGARTAAAITIAALATAGCVIGAPRGFSPGTSWTFPLVGPLEDGLLLVTGSVRGHGPYLFAIDPDANVTELDQQIVAEAELRGGVGPHRIDETDTGRVRFYAEMIDLQIASLKIDRRDIMVFPNGFYDTEGRHINGIIGRDVIADSLVFGFDREQGIATLTTVRAFKPPPGAVAIKYDTISAESNAVVGRDAPRRVVARGSGGGGATSGAGIPGGGRAPVYDEDYDNVPARLNTSDHISVQLPDVLPVPRRLATVQIGGQSFAMHLDLGATTSQLRERSWDKARLARADVQLRLVDEAATVRDVTSAGVASQVALGDQRSGAVSSARFVPYVENRFVVDHVDGALGLDFFRPYAVYANWDAQTFLLAQRADTPLASAARFARWGQAVARCAHAGCVAVDVAASGGGGALIRAVRDPEAAHRDLEVLIAIAPPGAPATRMLVELPAQADSASGALPGDLAGAAVSVLDVSPVPRSCPGHGGCLFPLRAQVEGGLGLALARPQTSRNVAFTQLHRRTGEPKIPPDGDVVRVSGGQPFAAAIVRICLSTDGTVADTKIIKSSNVPLYDEQLQGTIRTTWTFDPVTVDNAPSVCTSATFQQQ